MISLPTICHFIDEKKMRTKLILFGLILFAIPIHAMKRSYPFKKKYSRNNCTNISQAENTIIIPNLEGIIEDIIENYTDTIRSAFF